MKLDHGLVVSQREIIQDAIIALLARLRKEAGGPLEAIIPVDFRIHDDASWDLAEKACNGRFPALTIGVLDMDRANETMGRGHGHYTLDVQITVISKSLHSPQRGRMPERAKADERLDPGIWWILEATHALLFDAALSIARASELRLFEESEMVSEGEVTSWYQIYKLPVRRDVDWMRDVLSRLTSLSTEVMPDDETVAAAAITPVPTPTP